MGGGAGFSQVVLIYARAHLRFAKKKRKRFHFPIFSAGEVGNLKRGKEVPHAHFLFHSLCEREGSVVQKRDKGGKFS